MSKDASKEYRAWIKHVEALAEINNLTDKLRIKEEKDYNYLVDLWYSNATPTDVIKDLRKDYNMTDDASRQQAQRDQILAAWQDSIPPMVMNMYNGFLKVGFDKDQALDLAKFMWRDIRGQAEEMKRKQFPEDQ